MNTGQVSVIGGASQIEELVRQYMEIESRPMASLKNAKQALSTRAAMFRDLNASLLSLKNASSGLIPDDLASLYEARTVISSQADVLTAEADTSAAKAVYGVYVERLASYDTVVSGRFANAATDISGASGEGTKLFTIALGGSSWDIDISVAAGDDNAAILSKLAKAINSSDAGIALGAAVVSEEAGSSRLVITSRSTGSGNAITLSEGGEGSDILAASGISSSVQSSGSSGGYLVARDMLDARFGLNGLNFVRSSNVVSDAIPGVTLTLRKAQASGEAPVGLEVTLDAGAIESKIKAFISSYNATLKYVQNKTMVDADAGIRGDLAGEVAYNELKLKMARAVQGRVEGIASPAPSRLFDIGITRDKAGQLALTDESKLHRALTENPQAVQALFASEGGVAEKVRDLIEPFVEATGIIDRQQRAITDQMRRIDSRVKSLEERLALREKALRAEFASLLRALALVSAQNSLLSNLMAQANSFLVY